MSERMDLAGTWNLRRAGERAAVPMRVPGDNLSALLEAGRVPDPYSGANELAVQWVGREDWLLGRELRVDPAFLRGRTPWLYLESLDTCAEVRLNGRPVASSANMFRPVRADLAGLLAAGPNRLEIRFRSAEKEAARLAASLPYPLPHSAYPVQSPHRNLVRKVQCHSGWDWGPCLLVSGLYGAAWVGASESGRLDYAHTRARPLAGGTGRAGGGGWELEVAVEFHAWREARLPVEISIAGRTRRSTVEVRPGANVFRRTATVRGVEPWWPAGHGAQPLYPLRVRVGGEEARLEVGFRTLEVVQADDAHGRGLVFRVNGREVFCKGANWVPADALPSRQTPQRLESLLAAAAAANMNMLRVWGGGQYESDLFYSLCDRKGLLVWQDFMFSCATYPASPAFLAEAEAEARHQVKRLKSHPCLALWCGNNEDLGALTWFPETLESRDRYVVDYDRLNEGVIGRVVRELDPQRTWWPSSPCAGEGDYSDNWHDDSRGDMHYWSVWHEGKSFESYHEVTPRFCSEFGFQSFPSLETVRAFAAEEQWNPTSPVMEHHQRHPRGNAVIVETMTRYFRLPEGFDGFLYLSQVQQALAIKTAVEHWRSRRPLCMGVLYWQLNDVWPAASWSSLEHSGKWKLLHHLARRFYAPLHVAAFCPDGRNVQAAAMNDGAAPARGELEARFLDFTGRVRLERRLPLEVAGGSAVALAAWPLAGLPFAPEEAFLHLRATFTGRRRVVENELFLCPPKRCALEPARIEAEVREGEGGPVVELSTDRPAFWVFLEAEGVGGNFADNGFTLLPGEPKRIPFAPAAAAAGDGARDGAAGGTLRLALRNSLKVRHLRGSYR